MSSCTPAKAFYQRSCSTLLLMRKIYNRQKKSNKSSSTHPTRKEEKRHEGHGTIHTSTHTHRVFTQNIAQQFLSLPKTTSEEMTREEMTTYPHAQIFLRVVCLPAPLSLSPFFLISPRSHRHDSLFKMNTWRGKLRSRVPHMPLRVPSSCCSIRASFLKQRMESLLLLLLFGSTCCGGG